MKFISKTTYTCTLLAVSAILWTTADAATIYESALPASSGQGGLDSGATIGGYSGSGQIYGARFSISQGVHVDSIGGLFFAQPQGNQPQPYADDIFGAILRLASIASFPTGDPFSAAEVVASTVFHVGSTTAHEVITPLSADLDAGAYALVFGSGRFGATGIAAAPPSGQSLSAQYIYWGDSSGPTSWHTDGSSGSARFFVLGTVPEPASAALLLFGAALCLTRRTLRTHERIAEPGAAANCSARHGSC